MNKNFCKLCGARLTPDAAVCPRCGRPLSPGSAADAPAAAQLLDPPADLLAPTVDVMADRPMIAPCSADELLQTPPTGEADSAPRGGAAANASGPAPANEKTGPSASSGGESAAPSLHALADSALQSGAPCDTPAAPAFDPAQTRPSEVFHNVFGFPASEDDAKASPDAGQDPASAPNADGMPHAAQAPAANTPPHPAPGMDAQTDVVPPPAPQSAQTSAADAPPTPVPGADPQPHVAPPPAPQAAQPATADTPPQPAPGAAAPPAAPWPYAADAYGQPHAGPSPQTAAPPMPPYAAPGAPQYAAPRMPQYAAPPAPQYAAPGGPYPYAPGSWGYGAPTQPDLVSTGSYLGMFLLGCIPLAGLIYLIVQAAGNQWRPNRRNFARGLLAARAILLGAAYVLLLLVGVWGSMNGFYY